MDNNKKYTNVSFEDEGFVNECLEAFDKNVEQIECDGKKVIVRVDFNVPVKDGKILDNTRIKKSLKTINLGNYLN